ncbi:unnamed protein product [Urochloa decumbens]|uniref:DUF3615 domain-containing protein n=1 Tax=Urochloa decumbens TaxID=240449 RepID=A0ABC9B2Y4_9POAL
MPRPTLADFTEIRWRSRSALRPCKTKRMQITRSHEMPARLRPRSAPPPSRRCSVEEPAASSSSRPPRRGRSLPRSAKTGSVNTSRLPAFGASSSHSGSEQVPGDTFRTVRRSQVCLDQKQNASAGHEELLAQATAQNVTLADAALTHFNKENPEDEYMLVRDDPGNAPMSRVFVHDGPWFHCNFSARAKNDGNRLVRFYAEIFYAEAPRVRRCCILITGTSEAHQDRTCGLCGGNTRQHGILHPPDVLGYQNWLGWGNGVDSFVRHGQHKPDQSRYKHKLQQQFRALRTVE